VYEDRKLSYLCLVANGALDDDEVTCVSRTYHEHTSLTVREMETLLPCTPYISHPVSAHMCSVLL